jgi:hypothetical protein
MYSQKQYATPTFYRIRNEPAKPYVNPYRNPYVKQTTTKVEDYFSKMSRVK